MNSVITKCLRLRTRVRCLRVVVEGAEESSARQACPKARLNSNPAEGEGAMRSSGPYRCAALDLNISLFWFGPQQKRRKIMRALHTSNRDLVPDLARMSVRPAGTSTDAASKSH